ncbi:MAG: nuclear transport factor 2 family protein [Dehalococcoidia bacterium]
MATRIDLFRDFMTLQTEGKLDDAVAMLAGDVVLTDPMTGTATGKAAVEAAMRSRPPGASDMNLTWSEPEMEGDTVKLIGTGSPFGPVIVVVGFDSADRISRIDIGLG